MATQIHAPEPTRDAVLDTSASGLAELLDGIAQPFIGLDPAIATILCSARDSLQAVGWNRWVAQCNSQSRARRMRRRHQGWRYGHA